MATVVRNFDVEQDEAFERRSFNVQRAGWLVMILIVAAGVTGLLGSGPVGKAAVAAPGAFTVEYERLTRYQAEQTLQIHLQPTVTGRPETRLWISRQFLDSSKIETVVPTPVRVEGSADRVYYVFHMAKPGDPLSVSFNLQAEQIGLVDGRVGVDHGHEVTLKQFVYP